MNLINIRNNSKNVYSQSSEDSIIQQLLLLISESHSLSKWCVEFGAWDGKFLSNTFNLVENYSYKGVYIEGSKNILLS